MYVCMYVCIYVCIYVFILVSQRNVLWRNKKIAQTINSKPKNEAKSVVLDFA